MSLTGLDFGCDTCPICTSKMPIGWSSLKLQSNSRNSKITNQVAIYNGFCSSPCYDKFIKVSDIIKFGCDTLLLRIDKQLLTNVKKLTPCSKCDIPFMPREIIDNGGSLEGCGTGYGIPFHKLPFVLQKYIREPKNIHICTSCYNELDSQSASISLYLENNDHYLEN